MVMKDDAALTAHYEKAKEQDPGSIDKPPFKTVCFTTSLRVNGFATQTFAIKIAVTGLRKSGLFTKASGSDLVLWHLQSPP